MFARLFRFAVLSALLLILSLSISAAGAEGEREGTKLQKLRFPEYSNGYLWVELLATRANNMEFGSATLEDVTIRIYDVPDTTPIINQSRDGVEEIVPPLKYVITSNSGHYNAKTGVSTLTGDVVAVRYVDTPGPDGKSVRAPEAKLDCEEAIWRSNAGQLVSQGRVKVTRPNGDVLEGDDLIYTMADKKAGRPPSIILKKNVTMLIHSIDAVEAGARKDAGLGPDPAAVTEERQPTHIVCQGAAWYDLREGTVRFTEHVIVSRDEDRMQSEHLKVVMGKRTEKGGSHVVQLHAENSVRIKGRQVLGDGTVIDYTARGEDGVYDASRNILFLRGEGENLPEVRYGEYWIQDEVIAIRRNTGILTATGKKRESARAVLQADVEMDGDDDDDGNNGATGEDKPLLTHIQYGGSLMHDRRAGTARFDGGVSLKHPNMSLKSDALEVKTPEAAVQDGDEEGHAPLERIRRVTALRNVVIVTRDGRQATASEAVFDTLGNTLTLKGPPDPVVEQAGEFHIRAPHITSKSIPSADGKGQSIEQLRAGGPGTMKFLFREKEKSKRNTDVWQADETTLVSFGEGGGMSYNALTERAVFTGEVVLTRGDLVLKTEQLEVVLTEDQEAGDKKDNDKGEGESTFERAGLRIEKLIARQNVRMHAKGGRHTACSSMVYDVNARTITLFGEELERARVWEERGSSLRAMRIVDIQDKHRIEADGPGELTLAEPGPLGTIPRSARISFEGRLIYSAVPGKPAEALFYRDVNLRWQDMTVSGDRLDAQLGEAADVGKALAQQEALNEGGEPGLLRRGIETAVVTGHVKVKSGGRHANGDQALVMRRNSSLTLTGENGAELYDEQGIRLQAPRFVLYRKEQVMKADGAGVLYIAADAATREGMDMGGGNGANGSVAKDALPGEHPLDYTLSYEGQMIYDLSERRLLFERNVEIKQMTLYGRCERVEALMRVDDGRRTEDPDTQGLSLATIVCTDNVFLRHYEPPREGESLEDVIASGSSSNRPGTTVLVEAQEALFDVAENKITFSGSKRKAARILEQTVTRRGRVTRTLYQNVDKAVLDRGSGDVSFPFSQRRPNILHLPGDGPMRFED